ncbi:MAG: Gfo/Idh/MocA family oxidoreductase, partial [Chloroflexota bacterium]|nr:Gfo/Idh/MocA family oxidoreductase [Chloroflexota bacterium]
MATKENGQNLRIGIVGCGGIGGRHLLSYKNNGYTPTALADAFPEAASNAADKWGGKPYGDWREMFTHEQLDAVSVCTPPNVHREVSVAALEAGIPVLCEKPMTTKLEDAEAIAQAAEATGTLFFIGHCHRFQPQIQKLRELIDAGELGAVRMFRTRIGFNFPRAESSWFTDAEVSGGGILIDTHVHSVDIFRYLCGEVEEVTALTSTMETPLGPAMRVEDSAIMTVRSTDGVLGVMEASWRTPPGEVQVTVYGTAARAVVNYQTLQLTLQKADEQEARPIVVPDANRFDREIEHFLACVRGEQEPRLKPEDGVIAIRCLMAAYES